MVDHTDVGTLMIYEKIYFLDCPDAAPVFDRRFCPKTAACRVWNKGNLIRDDSSDYLQYTCLV